MKDKTLTFVIIGIIALLGNWLGYGVSPMDALPGMVIIVAVTLLGFLLAKIIPIKLPVVIWISVLALVMTTPIFPADETVIKFTEKVNFMALATPILAYAGLSFGKDLQEFKKLGWRIVVISLVVYTGTFVLSTLVAEIGFRMTGKFH